MIKIFLREKIIIHFCMYTQFSCEKGLAKSAEKDGAS